MGSGASFFLQSTRGRNPFTWNDAPQPGASLYTRKHPSHSLTGGGATPLYLLCTRKRSSHCFHDYALRLYGLGGGSCDGGRGLHSSTFQLNLSAFYGIGGARGGSVARVEGGLWGVFGVQGGFVCQTRLKLS